MFIKVIIYEKVDTLIVTILNWFKTIVFEVYLKYTSNMNNFSVDFFMTMIGSHNESIIYMCPKCNQNLSYQLWMEASLSNKVAADSYKLFLKAQNASSWEVNTDLE